MGQALYRKYRSKSLSEIVGQEHITDTLQNAIKNGRISHAYLFTGPRGVGKTSIARILAHEVNQLPYNDSATHIDIIEIDAASNRRIDEIRDLRDKVHTAPASAKYKVYIIDEVHMLTKEAFNALLKTLEEPPAHVIFILATTEAHKLPETIVSRTQRFTFRPIEPKLAVKHLGKIAKQEGIVASPEALELIAQYGDGSFRDSISLLDQLGNHGKRVEADDVLNLLGVAPQTAIAQLSELVSNGTPKDLLEKLQSLTEQSFEPAQIAKQLGQHLRSTIKEGVNTGSLQLYKQLIEVPASHNPAALLEVILLEANLKSVKPPVTTTKPVAPTPPKAAVAAKAQSITQPVATPLVTNNASFTENWQKILADIRKSHNTLYGILRMVQASQENDTVTLACAFPFHQKRLQDSKNQSVIAKLAQQYLGRPVQLVCVVDATVQPPNALAEAKPANLENISNIFGTAEVLES